MDFYEAIDSDILRAEATTVADTLTELQTYINGYGEEIAVVPQTAERNHRHVLRDDSLSTYMDYAYHLGTMDNLYTNRYEAFDLSADNITIHNLTADTNDYYTINIPDIDIQLNNLYGTWKSFENEIQLPSQEELLDFLADE